MNYFEAHELLERVKHGHRPPIEIINRALCYANLAMTKGWLDYTRQQVKELRDSSEMWADLPRMVKERIDGHKHAERTRIAESGT